MTEAASMNWSREFDEPIPLPNGRELVTLEDAGRYVDALPRSMHEREEWQMVGAERRQARSGDHPTPQARQAPRDRQMTVFVLREYEQAGRRRRSCHYVSISFMKTNRNSMRCIAFYRTGSPCAPSPSSAR
jgi:hypothetical protein